MGTAAVGGGAAAEVAFGAEDGFGAGDDFAADSTLVAAEADEGDGDLAAAGVGVTSGVPGRGYPELRSDGTDTIGSLDDEGSVARRLSFSTGVGDSSCPNAPRGRAASKSTAAKGNDLISSMI